MPRTRSDTADAPGPSPGMGTWLAGLDDDALVALLVARPDVATPPPATLEVLASRLRLPAATARAVDALDTPGLLVLATAIRAGADTRAVETREIAGALGVATDDPLLSSALGDLRRAALLWGDDGHRASPVTAASVDAAPVVAAAVDDPPAEQLGQAVDAVSGQARSMLGTLARARVPRGTLTADPDSPARAVVGELREAGLVTVSGDGAVVPRARALDLLRHGRSPGESLLEPPRWSGRPVSGVDSTAGVAALDLLHRCEEVLDALAFSPAASLKAGGVGVRELRRLARTTGIDEAELPLLLELLAAARLVACGDCELGGEELDEIWAPTDGADLWRGRETAQRWAALVEAWWVLPRRPWLVGTDLEGGGTAACLSDSLSAPGAPAERLLTFRALDLLPPGLDPGPETFDEVLRWSRPVRFGRSGGTAPRATLAEARILGVVVGGSPTTTARALAAGVTDDLSQLLTPMLPEPVSEVIVQADLTILAPGPLVPELATEFALVADIESSGAATTYRVTEVSLRRALDSGRTAAQISDLLARTSVTPVPQAVTYLVEDVARRHGRLRVASALSVVRCDDPALVAQVLSSPVAERCAVRPVGPTVLLSQARPVDLVDALREHGFAPVVEDTSGAVVSLTRRGARVVPAAGRRTPRVAPGVPSEDELRAAVAHLRSADRARAARGGATSPRRTGEAAVALLHEAVRTATGVAVEVVDADGRAATRLVVPVVVGAGRLEGVEPGTSHPVGLALHRVISVTELTGDPDRH